MTLPLSGVFAAVLTPLGDALAPDHQALVRHSRWLLQNGCHGLAVLGTTGEANSFSVEERLHIFDALAAAGIPGNALLPGTGCCAVPDTVRLTRAALSIGVAGVLMLPPFYYKNVSDDGVFAAYAETIQRLGDDRLRIYLYHFPQMSGVPIRLSVIERLRHRFGPVIAGMKDSSGELSNMLAAVRAVPDFAVFSGSDEYLALLLRAGGAGCITAVCNVASALAREVWEAVRVQDDAAAERAQTRLSAIRQLISAHPLTAALKEIMADHAGVNEWRAIRPPLVRVDAAAAASLASGLDRLGFSPPPVT